MHLDTYTCTHWCTASHLCLQCARQKRQNETEFCCAKRIFLLNFHVLSIFNRVRLYNISIAPQRIYHIHLQMCLDWMGQIIWLYVYVCVCIFLLLRPQAMIFHKTIPLNDTHVFRIKTHIIFISYGLTHYEHVDVSWYEYGPHQIQNEKNWKPRERKRLHKRL